MTLSLRQLVTQLETRHTAGHGPAVVCVGDPDDLARTTVESITHDSRQVASGSLFACVPGAKVDGHRFAQQAVDDGAVALLVQHEVTTNPAVPQLIVNDVRAHLGIVAAEVYGNPAERLTMVGITGTNGKTSTAHLLADMLSAQGFRSAVIGTLTQTRTTPEATEVHAMLASHVASGVTHVVMEVTSHALVLSRVVGVKFDVAIFTNLTQDHLDFHETMEAYFRAKAELFAPHYSKRAVVNLDDPYGRLLRDAGQIPTDVYSLGDVTDLEVGAPSRFTWRGHQVVLPLGGLFSVANALAAATAALLLGVSEESIVDSLSRAYVPGRFETVDAGQSTTVIVDYAHTPDGLERVLESARSMVAQRHANGIPSQLIAVFGCGGDRDREKRPIMGEIAYRLADVAILTSDNPRSEDPQRIIDDVLEGIHPSSLEPTGVDGAAGHSTRLIVEVDRRTAIRAAIVRAQPHDVVIIAGKGHEQGQDIGGVIAPFDDREVAREELAALGNIT